MLTAEMLEPVVTSITTAITVVIPIGLGIFGTIKGIQVGLRMLSNLVNG